MVADTLLLYVMAPSHVAIDNLVLDMAFQRPRYTCVC